MKLLALDTATAACTVALWLDGEVLERFEPEGRHSEQVLPMVDGLLAEAGLMLAQLDALVFGRGPGSFTGLRIGAGVAQGLAFGADLPVVPVSSLAALAQSLDAPQVLAALDARMQQVYWAACTRNAEGIMQVQGREGVYAPGDVPVPEGSGWQGAGPGWHAYADALRHRLGNCISKWHPQVLPRARHVAALGAFHYQAGDAVAAEDALPIYIRDDVAIKSSKR